MTHDHQDLIALIRSRGGSLSVRQLQHARRIYRQSAGDARDALHSLAAAGYGSLTGDTLTLNPDLQTHQDFDLSKTNTSHLPVTIEGLPITSDTLPATQTTLALQPTTPSQDVSHAAMQPTGDSTQNVQNDQPHTLVLPRASETRAEATNRWVREGRKVEADNHREKVRLECLAGGMSRFDANQRAWESAMATFPRPGQPPSVADQPPVVESAAVAVDTPTPIAGPEPSAGQVVGIGVLPPTWPELPPNASLAAEVSWVQSSRLDVVQPVPGGYRVDLSRADRPAPSKGALSWLETSILFPSKFADVSVRAAQGATDEQEDARRERSAVEEVGRLLTEMTAEPASVAAG